MLGCYAIFPATEARMMSLQEVHNVLHCRQKRIEPRPQVTCKFGEVCACGYETCITGFPQVRQNKIP